MVDSDDFSDWTVSRVSWLERWRQRREFDRQFSEEVMKPGAAILQLAYHLKRLSELRDSGVLSEAEFEEQKAKLLESD